MSDSKGRERVAMEGRRRATLSRFGEVAPRVLSRVTPIFMTDAGPSMRVWPSSALGKQLIVRSKDSVMVVTDGLSDPWDFELHPDAPDWTFGFEMSLEVPYANLSGGTSDEAIASSWIPSVLWAATDWIAAERFDLKGRLISFTCITTAVPPLAGLESLVGKNGYIGGLIGIPRIGSKLGAQAVLAREDAEAEDATWLLPMKLLTADEYDWAVGVEDSSRALALAEAFLTSSTPYQSWLERRSIIAERPSITTRTSKPT